MKNIDLKEISDEIGDLLLFNSQQPPVSGEQVLADGAQISEEITEEDFQIYADLIDLTLSWKLEKEEPVSETEDLKISSTEPEGSLIE